MNPVQSAKELDSFPDSGFGTALRAPQQYTRPPVPSPVSLTPVWIQANQIHSGGSAKIFDINQ